MVGIHDGTILEDVEFDLFEKDRDGNTLIVKYKGAWLVVDNGYLKWSTTIPPLKVTDDRREIRWSNWMESMRKDVECTFGIMKGRFRLLKAGMSNNDCLINNLMYISNRYSAPWSRCV